MRSERFVRRVLRVEELEPRLVLSQGLGGAVVDELGVQDAKAGAAQAVGPAIRLDLVALHEVGHALGLAHSGDPSSIMYGYYNANYDVGNFANDPAVTGAGTYVGLQEIYTGANSGPWKDSLDPTPGNGVVDVTYSFVPDGARMESGRSTLFTTMNKLFGSASAWQPIFAGALNLWEGASNGVLNFVSHVDTGVAFNYFGLSQNDARAGDIRIGAHTMDGAGKVLAHAYYPPPNGWTAAGDMHFDRAENWVIGSSVSNSPVVAGSGANGKQKGDLTAGELGVAAGQVSDVVVAELCGQAEGEQSATAAVGYEVRVVGAAPVGPTGVVTAAVGEDASGRSRARFAGVGEEGDEIDELFESLEMLEYPWDLDWLVMGTALGAGRRVA